MQRHCRPTVAAADIATVIDALSPAEHVPLVCLTPWILRVNTFCTFFRCLSTSWCATHGLLAKWVPEHHRVCYAVVVIRFGRFVILVHAWLIPILHQLSSDFFDVVVMAIL